jgi:hypothetical protein
MIAPRLRPHVHRGLFLPAPYIASQSARLTSPPTRAVAGWVPERSGDAALKGKDGANPRQAGFVF